METRSSRYDTRSRFTGSLVLTATAALLILAAPPAYSQDVEWRSYGSDAAGTKYSPLDQINRETIGDLRIAWRDDNRVLMTGPASKSFAGTLAPELLG